LYRLHLAVCTNRSQNIGDICTHRGSQLYFHIARYIFLFNTYLVMWKYNCEPVYAPVTQEDGYDHVCAYGGDNCKHLRPNESRIKFVSDLWKVGGFLLVHRFPSPIKLSLVTTTIYGNWNIVECGVKHHNPNTGIYYKVNCFIPSKPPIMNMFVLTILSGVFFLVCLYIFGSWSPWHTSKLLSPQTTNRRWWTFWTGPVHICHIYFIFCLLIDSFLVIQHSYFDKPSNFILKLTRLFF
jgi:hypothetical protein